MNNMKKNFITGFLVSLPMILTIWILLKIFNTLDSLIGDQITYFIGYRIPGLGLILGVCLLTLIGSIASNIIGRKLTSFVESKFEQLPIIKKIYQPTKDILNNFSNKKSNNFKKAVFVEFPKEDSLSIGFITKENVSVDGEIKTIVFVPTTPNPTSGFLVYLNRGEYKELDIPVEVALKSIISLGSVSPDLMLTK